MDPIVKDMILMGFSIMNGKIIPNFNWMFHYKHETACDFTVISWGFKGIQGDINDIYIYIRVSINGRYLIAGWFRMEPAISMDDGWGYAAMPNFWSPPFFQRRRCGVFAIVFFFPFRDVFFFFVRCLKFDNIDNIWYDEWCLLMQSA